jgi:hypothetical protein
MSEEASQADATEQARRYAGLIGVGGDEADRKHATGQRMPAAQTQAEREYNASVFGQTYRERASVYRGTDPCIVLCQAPNETRVNRCPSCYGKAIPGDIYLARLQPMPGRAARFAAWAGGAIGTALAAFAEAVTFPFRVGRAHTAALVRDILQEAIGAGLTAEVDGLHEIITTVQGLARELEHRNATEGQKR